MIRALVIARGTTFAAWRHWLACPLVVVVVVTCAAGCVKNRPATATTRPATAVDPAQADPEYWLRQPATVHALSTDFDALWEAAEETALDHNFAIDRRDQRFGLLTTHPAISKQWFELWREDASGAEDVLANSLGTIRRTIRFEFAEEAGRFTAAPKVLVERHSVIDPKYREQSSDAPTAYWYALGRDTALERRLAQAVQKRLTRETAAAASR
jgi:hypothetical protein